MTYTHVFGIGLNKTGTTSLKLAFQKLGFHHMDRRAKAFRLYRNKRWAAIWDMIEGYETFEDWPWPLMVPELLDHFGDRARFVLTRRRTAESWVESLKGHAMKTNPDQNPRAAIFGYPYPHGREAEHVAFYNNHLKGMRALFAGRPGQMCELCWEEGDGWPELCAFLNLPEPLGAFPHANQGAGARIDPERHVENERRIIQQLAQSTKE